MSPGNKENSQPALAGAIRLKVPNSFLTELSRGVFELGDADEPMNHWRFGKPADIFELDYVGKCSIASGIVGVIGAKELLDMSSAESWQHLQELVDNASDTFPAAKSSFMFAGRYAPTEQQHYQCLPKPTMRCPACIHIEPFWLWDMKHASVYRVVQSDTVSIYTYKEGGEIKGLQISSDAEELD